MPREPLTWHGSLYNKHKKYKKPLCGGMEEKMKDPIQKYFRVGNNTVDEPSTSKLSFIRVCKDYLL